jgi:hypothetical protein
MSGCLLDFTEYLSDARQKVLRGYVCHHCRCRMQEDGEPTLADTVTHLLDRQWLGQPTDPRTPAGVMVSLRYDLFTAKGRQETPKEAFLTALRQRVVRFNAARKRRPISAEPLRPQKKWMLRDSGVVE